MSDFFEAENGRAPTWAVISFPGEYGQDGAFGAKHAITELGLELVFDGEGLVTPAPDDPETEIITGIVGSAGQDELPVIEPLVSVQGIPGSVSPTSNDRFDDCDRLCPDRSEMEDLLDSGDGRQLSPAGSIERDAEHASLSVAAPLALEEKDLVRSPENGQDLVEGKVLLEIPRLAVGSGPELVVEEDQNLPVPVLDPGGHFVRSKAPIAGRGRDAVPGDALVSAVGPGLLADPDHHAVSSSNHPGTLR
jgi:hypothetical protein